MHIDSKSFEVPSSRGRFLSPWAGLPLVPILICSSFATTLPTPIWIPQSLPFFPSPLPVLLPGHILPVMPSCKNLVLPPISQTQLSWSESQTSKSQCSCFQSLCNRPTRRKSYLRGRSLSTQLAMSKPQKGVLTMIAQVLHFFTLNGWKNRWAM